MPMPAATIASTPALANKPTGRMHSPSSCGGLATSLVPVISPSAISTTVKQSQWPKCPARSDSNPASPIVGTASFIVSPISPFFHSCPDNTSNVVSFQLRQAAFQQLDQQIIEAPSRPKGVDNTADAPHPLRRNRLSA